METIAFIILQKLACGKNKIKWLQSNSKHLWLRETKDIYYTNFVGSVAVNDSQNEVH